MIGLIVAVVALLFWIALYVWCAQGDCGFPPPKVTTDTGSPREKIERAVWESGR